AAKRRRRFSKWTRRFPQPMGGPLPVSGHRPWPRSATIRGEPILASQGGDDIPRPVSA
ncbi:hypothetical protein BHM03_00050260, partial [Ensete ventricosum]